MSTQTFIGVLSLTTCCRDGCGVTFGMPSSWMEFYKNNHQNFYCPAGHGQHFTSESKEEKLARELEETQRKLTGEKCVTANLRTSLQNTQVERDRQARLKREKAKKLKRVCERVAHGVCPCCNRTVAQLAAHMKSKHPDYVAKKGDVS